MCIRDRQEGLYTLYLRGSEKGQKVDAKRVISCVSDLSLIHIFVHRKAVQHFGRGVVDLVKDVYKRQK